MKIGLVVRQKMNSNKFCSQINWFSECLKFFFCKFLVYFFHFGNLKGKKIFRIEKNHTFLCFIIIVKPTLLVQQFRSFLMLENSLKRKINSKRIDDSIFRSPSLIHNFLEFNTQKVNQISGRTCILEQFQPQHTQKIHKSDLITCLMFTQFDQYSFEFEQNHSKKPLTFYHSSAMLSDMVIL